MSPTPNPSPVRPDPLKRKLCVLCKHFEFDGGSRGYSELTPGDAASLDCRKHVWHQSMYGMDSAEYRALMLTAETCAQFELADDLKDLPHE